MKKTNFTFPVYPVLLGLPIVFSGCQNNSEAKKSSNQKPNVILIMADDLGYAELGSYGQKLIKTPNIDQLASEGMRFNNFYSSSAVSAPSRCGLMTGLHGGHAYVRNNQEIGEWFSFRGQLPLPEGTKTVASILKENGYATGCFGKWGLGEPGSSGDPLKQGFDRFYGYNCQKHAHNLYPRYLINDDQKDSIKGNNRGLTGEKYGPQLIADEMLNFVRENKEKPFFLYYPTVIPHLALQVPEEELEQYEGKWTETPYTGTSYLPHPKPRAAYAGMISFMDKQIGRLMKLLQELNLDKNTIVIFTSDNGTTHLEKQVDYEFFNSVGNLRGLKGSLYEGGIKVPMIARWPEKIEAGSTSDIPGVGYDMLETIADITSTTTDDTDGISFLPTFLGKDSKQKKREYLFWDFAGYGKQIAVRMGKWKGIKPNIRNKKDVPLELYNLENDPGETNNIALDNPDVSKHIEKIMLEARIKPEFDKFAFGTYREEF
jgi:arylsulfatase